MEKVQFLFGTEILEAGVKKVEKLFGSITKVAERTAKGIDKEFSKVSKDITKLPSAIGKTFALLGKGFGDVKTKIFGKSKGGKGESLIPDLGGGKGGGGGGGAEGGVGLGVVEKLKGGLKSLIGPAIAAAAAFTSIKGAMDAIPEIGETFRIAGSIITRNFFEPLRKELLPILQSILNWVTSHRTDFVRWGSVLVNAFRVATTAAKVLYTFLSSAVTGLFRGLTKYFFNTAQSFEDIFNLLLLKLTVVLLFIEPYIKKLGDLFGSVLEALVGFYKNYVEAYLGGRFIQLLKDIVKAVGDLWTAITNINVAGVTLGNVFNKVGLIIGSIVGVQFENFLITLKTILKVATDLINLDFSQLGKDIIGAGKDIIGNYKGRGKTIFNAFTQKESKVEDAIIKSDGSIIHTDPSDNIIATKNTPTVNGGGGVGGSIQIGSIVGAIHLQVTEGNARNAAEAFGESLSDKIRAILRRELAVSGGF